MHPFIKRYEGVLVYYSIENCCEKLNLSIANAVFATAFNNLKRFAAEVCFYLVFKGNETVFIKDAPNKCANK